MIQTKCLQGQAFNILVAFQLLFFSNSSLADKIPRKTKSKVVTHYYQLQDHILKLISQSKRQLTVLTRDLSDGDLASSIYLAHYRGVQVKVILLRKHIREFQSRYFFLNSQRVPIQAVESGPFGKINLTTAILTEKASYKATCTLNKRSGCKGILIKELSSIEGKYLNHYSKELFKNYVIKKEDSSVQFSPPPRSAIMRFKKHQNNHSEGYRYSNKHKKRPANIPTKLPKETIWQKKEKQFLQE